MCGTRSRIFLLLLVGLLLLQCSFAWADVVYTEAQVTALNLHLDSLEKELNEQKQNAETLQAQLTGARSELKQAQNELQTAKNSLEKSQQELKGQKTTLGQLEKSLDKERKLNRWGKVKAFAIGLVVGAAGGLAGGYYLMK